MISLVRFSSFTFIYKTYSTEIHACSDCMLNFEFDNIQSTQVQLDQTIANSFLLSYYLFTIYERKIREFMKRKKDYL